MNIHQDLDYTVLLSERWPGIIHSNRIVSWLNYNVGIGDWHYRISTDVLSFASKDDALVFCLTFPDVVRK